jgi:hypothetical protein
VRPESSRVSGGGRQLSGASEHPSSYKDRWTIDDAVAELQAQRGRHFDPALVDAFLALVPDLEPDLLQQDSADARSDDQGDPGVGVLTLGQSTPAGATERIHSRKTESPTRA